MLYLQKKPESIMMVQSLFTQPGENLQHFISATFTAITW